MGGARGSVWQDRIDHLRRTIEDDVEHGRYYGAVIRFAHGGEVIFSEAIGGGGPGRSKPLIETSVFNIFSITKAFVNVLVMQAIELGRFALTTRVSEILPELSGSPRNRITIFNLLTHTAGLPSVWTVGGDLLGDRLDEVFERVIATQHGIVEPGTRCDYSPMVNHVLLAELLRRTDPAGRRFIDLVREELFEPLRMVDTAFGVRADLTPRHVVPDMRGTLPIQMPGRTKPGPYAIFEEEEIEMPWAGAVSTAVDLGRFTEMLRRGGELDGVRILSPVTLRAARRNWTGDMPNELYRAVALRAGWSVAPAYIGLGFNLRGTGMVNHQFGTLVSPDTFGNYGSGSMVYWIDPELDATFVGLTAGLLTQAGNIDRFQRLSDITVSALS